MYRKKGSIQYHRGRRKKRKKGCRSGTFFSGILIVITAVIFCVSLYHLTHRFWQYRQGEREYADLQRLVLEQSKEEQEEPDEDDPEDGRAEDGFAVDFAELLKRNPDTVGWIRFSPEPAVINYPIVQAGENQTYLHRTFSGEENAMGSIFLDAENRADFGDYNSILYGHRMKNGTMFRRLEDYKDFAYWKQNPYFYIYLPDGIERRYHIFGAAVVKDAGAFYQTTFADAEEYRNYLQTVKKAMLYETGVTVRENDRVVMLSTCTGAGDEHRFVVLGVLEWENSEQEKGE